VLVKTVILFLAGMALLAMIGRALYRRRRVALKPGTCPRCRAYVVGKGPCACGHVKR
jgi:hypothetical protein